MLCTSRSEYRFAVCLLNAAVAFAEVWIEGVWHCAQPMAAEQGEAVLSGICRRLCGSQARRGNA